MSNGDAANHWRAIEEEKLRKRIMELEAVAEAAERMHKHGSKHPADVRIEAALRAAGYLGGGK
jgi:hypothetical protein